jgi:hypothetical protein
MSGATTSETATTIKYSNSHDLKQQQHIRKNNDNDNWLESKSEFIAAVTFHGRLL